MWTNPKTGGSRSTVWSSITSAWPKEIGKALVDSTAEDSGEEPELVDTEKLAGKFVTDLALLVAKFNGIDTTKSDWESLAEARERIESEADREAFIKGFIAVERHLQAVSDAPTHRPLGHYWPTSLSQEDRPSTDTESDLPATDTESDLNFYSGAKGTRTPALTR